MLRKKEEENRELYIEAFFSIPSNQHDYVCVYIHTYKAQERAIYIYVIRNILLFYLFHFNMSFPYGKGAI